MSYKSSKINFSRNFELVHRRLVCLYCFPSALSSSLKMGKVQFLFQCEGKRFDSAVLTNIKQYFDKSSQFLSTRNPILSGPFALTVSNFD